LNSLQVIDKRLTEIERKGKSPVSKIVKEQVKEFPVPENAGELLSYNEALDLKPGYRVFHAKFGEGEILDIKETSNGASKIASIEFDYAGQKSLLLSFAKLRLIKN